MCRVRAAYGVGDVKDGPYRKLSAREESILPLVARGWDYEQIGNELNISPQYAENLVARIADLLPNPDDIKPYRLVMIWAVTERWIKERAPMKGEDAA